MTCFKAYRPCDNRIMSVSLTGATGRGTHTEPEPGCEHLIGQFPRPTGSNWARPPWWRTLKTTGIGVAKAVKTVVLCARLRAWARGEATTAVVTHAESVGSRWAACL